MFSHRDYYGESNNNEKLSSTLQAKVIFYLGAEILITAIIGILLAILNIIKRILPRPPRNLINDTVVVTGAASGLGKAIAEEFFKAGCIVACIDQNINCQENNNNCSIKNDKLSKYKRIEEIVNNNSNDNKNNEDNDICRNVSMDNDKIFTYKCNTSDRNDIIDVSKKINRDIGRINVLVTSYGDFSENILDAVTTNLMSHYWTMLAFIPSMIKSKRSHIVAVIPATSTHDAYMGSKAAVAGIIEAIGQQFTNANELTFTTVAPKVEPRLMRQSEQQTAKDIVEAVRRDRRTLTSSWASNLLYPLCCTVYGAITSFNEWLYRPGCDDLT